MLTMYLELKKKKRFIFMILLDSHDPTSKLYFKSLLQMGKMKIRGFDLKSHRQSQDM